jgi:hypothetical protein
MSMLVNPHAFAAGIVTDPNFANVVLLMGFEGADGSTTFDDESTSNKTITVNADAQIDTAQFKFGASSLLCDGTDDFISAADSADWVLGTGQYTAECWVRFNSIGAADQLVLGQWGANGSRAWGLIADNTSLVWWASTDGVSNNQGATASVSLTTGQWYHFAVDKDGSDKVRVYLDGAMVGSATGRTGSLQNSTSTFTIGRSSNAGFPNPFNGWVDEVRITKGVARYASDGGFSVPTAAFPRS